MSWFESASFKYPTADSSLPRFAVQQTALAQMGAMSPLWMLFMGASTMGMAYWSLTRWMHMAAPQKAGGSVVKLRLVKSAALPAAIPVADVEPAPAEELKASEPEIAPQPMAAPVEAVAEPVARAKPVRVARAKAPIETAAAEAAPVKATPAMKTVAPRKAAVRTPATKA